MEILDICGQYVDYVSNRSHDEGDIAHDFMECAVDKRDLRSIVEVAQHRIGTE